MDFGSSLSSSSLNSGFGVSSSNKSNNNMIMENLRQQIAVANAQELLSVGIYFHSFHTLLSKNL